MFDFRECAAPLFLSPATGEPVRDRGRDDGRCRDGRDTD
jgi:hypothetical protein